MELIYDRGTIIIDLGPPDDRKESLIPPCFLWDPRVNRFRAPAYRLPGILEWLRERKAECRYRSARPEGFVPAQVSRERLPGLRPYQEEAFQAWAAGGRRGLVALPTGSGKTRLALRAMLSMGSPAAVLVPTRQLLHQWRTAIAEFYPGSVGIFGDGDHQLEPITVITYESAHLHMDRIGDHFDLLVLDEAHHLASEEAAEALQMSAAACRLGLTATPPERSEFHERAVDLLGPTVYSLPIARLAGTYLASYEIKVIPLHLGPEEQAAYDLAREKLLLHLRPFFQACPQAGWSDFVRTASRTAGGREALAAHRKAQSILSLPRSKLSALDWLLDLHRDQAKLVFTADNRSAYEVSRRFLVPAITCDIGREERETILRRFREGSYRTIVSAKVLNEGIDVPAASVAVIAGGSPSPLEHAQRVGRVLRPQEGKKAIVYELVMAGTQEWGASERRGRKGVLDAAPSP